MDFDTDVNRCMDEQKHEPIDENEWYYVVRIGTNDRLTNDSSVNVCKEYHLKRLLSNLNYRGLCFEAMTIAEYNRKFKNVR